MRHDDVLALLQERLTAVAGTETVALEASLGRYAAETVVAPRHVPLHDNAAVDGYAFAYADYARRNTLGVTARIAAGDLQAIDVGRGEAARIFTGAVMPLNCDTVAMQEDCEISADGRTVTVPKGLKPGANRRRAGEDVREGAVALQAGHRLRPQDIAGLASIGLADVPVFSRLRVGILSTGSELVDPGKADALTPGQVFDSNRSMLKALAATLPLDIVDLGILRDDAATIERTLGEAAAQFDVLLTSGGASRGEEDHLVATLDKLGKRYLWQIAVKPGRPMTLGHLPDRRHDCVLFGLPGNPVAVFICFLLYVRPALVRLGGGEIEAVPRFRVAADFEIARKKPDRREFLRGWLEPAPGGEMKVKKFPRDGSGLISGLRAATGLIEIPEHVTHVRRNDLVDFIPLSAFGI